MARTKKSEPNAWERLLMLMVNGGPFSKEEIEKNIDYEYMYRLSSLVLYAKYNGALIRVRKNGRKIASYELVNIDEMKSYLSKRGFSAMKIKSEKIKSLKDISTKVVDEVVDEVEVTEVTEITQ
jgi:hypothetical protein